MYRRFALKSKKGLFFKDTEYIKRWPTAPKVAFFGPPGVFMDEIMNRFSIDLGVPVVSIHNLYSEVQQNAGRTPEFDHPFYIKVKAALDDEDIERREHFLTEEGIPQKLLRLNHGVQDGFILMDYPYLPQHCEKMEMYRGGLNAFVHIHMEQDILETLHTVKYTCQDCGRSYYMQGVKDANRGVHIEPFRPELEGVCDDCGSTNITEASDESKEEFMKAFAAYESVKQPMLQFYNRYGLLVDFEMKKGFDDYSKLRQQIQYTIKH